MTPSIRVVDLVLRILGRVPAPVLHNLDKSSMIRRYIWHLNVDQIPGAYVEFGVAMGHSLRSVEIAKRTYHLDSVGVKHIPRKLIGFDTFEHFASNVEFDSHPTWEGSSFNKNLRRLRRRFKKDTDKRIYLNKYDACSLVDAKGEVLVPHETCGLDENIALLLLDMDLHSPTISALEWSSSRIQQGTIIMVDEYFAFRARIDRGEVRAMKEFLSKHSSVRLREFGFYGSGGAVFVVSEC